MPVRSPFLLTLTFLAGVSTMQAMADPRTDVLLAATRCNAISDYRTWLECYYGAAQSLRAQLGLPPALPGQVALVPPAAPGQVAIYAPPPAYNPPVQVQPAPPLPHSQSALGAALGGNDDYVPRQRVAAYSFDKDALFTITLADGQIWKQVAQDSLYARWRAPAATYVASVVPGMFGSHLLRMSDGHSYRVSRVNAVPSR